MQCDALRRDARGGGEGRGCGDIVATYFVIDECLEETSQVPSVLALCDPA